METFRWLVFDGRVLCIVNAMRLFWVGACCVNVAGTAEVPISHPSVASCLDKLIGKRKDNNS